MGFDLCTVEKVPNGVFDRVDSQGREYFRHGGGVTTALALVGVDMKTRKRPGCGLRQASPVKSCSLLMTLCWNNGFQVTPDECIEIDETQTVENFFQHVVGHDDGGFCTYTKDDVGFFVDFVEFCDKASAYGGSYVF